MMKGGRTMKTDFLILQRVLGRPRKKLVKPTYKANAAKIHTL